MKPKLFTNRVHMLKLGILLVTLSFPVPYGPSESTGAPSITTNTENSVPQKSGVIKRKVAQSNVETVSFPELEVC